MKSTILIALVICLVCSISGCGGYSSNGGSNTPLTQTLAGTWDFTYVSATAGSATVSGTFSQTMGAFTASVGLTGTCSTTGTLSGTVTGSAITGTLTEANPETISVTGTISGTGHSASGTYQVMSATGACAAASTDTGTWSGTRTAVPIGPYSAMVRTAESPADAGHPQSRRRTQHAHRLRQLHQFRLPPFHSCHRNTIRQAS